MAGTGVSFSELLAQVGDQLTQIQRWQAELSTVRGTAETESGSMGGEVDAYGIPARLRLDNAALRLPPAELGREIVAMFAAAAAAVDGRRAEVDRELTAVATAWGRAATPP